MQFNLLQDDLFSAAGETLSPPPAKKSKPSKPSAVIPEPAEPSAAHPAVAAEAPAAAEALNAEAATDAHDHEKAPQAFKTISEVADFLGLPQHVLRFWESRFSQIKPLKMRGGRRYYRPDDIEILSTIKHLLYKQGYTINGAKKAFSQGKNALIQNVHAQEAGENAPAKPAAPKITDKQKHQLAAIRQELYALREQLRPFTQA